MDLVVIAGAHASACTGLRRQILAGAEALRGEGVHVPTSYGEEPRTWHNLAWEIAGMPGHRPALGTIAGTVEEAKQSGSARILLMSEEFETAAMQPEAVDRLAALATDLGGRLTVLIVFRHQMSYLNLVFAFRSINGIHGLWFEDFVRAPTPPRQFDYVDVVDRFDRPTVDVIPCALDEVITGGGLPWLLDRAAGLTVAELDVPGLEVETPPGRMRVHACLMAHRLATGRDPAVEPRSARRIAHQLGIDLMRELPQGGPFWGWTDELRSELLPGFRAANEQLKGRYGVTLVPDDPPPDAGDLHMRDIEPRSIKALLDHLDAATRVTFPDPAV